MNQEKLWLEFSTLPPHAQKVVLEFIAFMQKCYNQIQLGTLSDTLKSNFISETLPSNTRMGWDEQFKDMAQSGDDQLLDAEIVSLSEWDEVEWAWE